MRIIKPYGRSVADKTSRKIQETNADGLKDIAILLAEDKPLIAQWVGVIDKIIPKPKEVKEPRAGNSDKKKQKDYNNAQDLLKKRKDLGKAAWDYLIQNNKFKSADKAEIHKIWQRKIEATQPKAPREDKGRWHKAFIGFMPLNANFAVAVAEKIDKHLTQHSLAIQGEKKPKRIGLAMHRAHAVDKNILHKAAEDRLTCSDEDWSTYSAKAGEFADAIKKAILAIWLPRQNGDENQQKAYLERPFNIAVEYLRKSVWPRLFGDGINNFADADKQDRNLLHIHLAVKEAYKRLLKGHKRLDYEKMKQILPADNAILWRLVQHKKQNRDINHFIRLGKIIHYTAADKARAAEAAKTDFAGDETAFIAQHWPKAEEVANSRYWTSGGQTEIKQNEAFVRVWRRALAFAARTAKDWAETVSKTERDILASENITKVEAAFTESRDYKEFDKKYQLLFSDNVDAQCGVPRNFADKKAVMASALNGIKDLRNAAFHFKGLGTFIKALQKDGAKPAEISALYKQGRQYYQAQCKEMMKAAAFGESFKEKEILSLYDAVMGAAPVLPLPRLKKVLERAEKASWKGEEKEGKPLLPLYKTAEEREKSSWQRAQYTALKLLYDGPFNVWLQQEGNSSRINRYFDQAVQRSTDAAQKINADNTAIAKAKALKKLKDGAYITVFLSELTAATATEFRVQNGYAHNAAKAKEQAKYIENLKCDIIAQAFADYLKDKGWLFLYQPGRNIHPAEKMDFAEWKKETSGENNAAEEFWTAKLYFLLHLISVEEAGSLRHQLKKWEVVTQAEKMETGQARANEEEESKRVTALLQVFDLYLALHDAQFMVAGKGPGGQLAELLKQGYAQYYEQPEDFGTVFPEQKGQDNPQAFRDLREMQRFGSNVSRWFAAKDKSIYEVRHAALTEWQKQEGGIAAAQKEKMRLHEEWADAKNKKQWEQQNGQRYNELVQQVSEHQRLTAELRLQNHVRLHRLLMNVLGRLVDFSGLFERDVYFTLLALLYKKSEKEGKPLAPELQESMQEAMEQESDKAKDRKTPLGQQFCPALKDNKDANGETIKKPNAHGIYFLTSGQIIGAFCKLTEKNRDIKAEITKLFSITGADTSYEERDGKKYKLDFRESNEHLKKADYRVWIRNRFAHLAVLEEKNLPVALTTEVNNARQLMAYDRKLKNAVTKALIDLLDREGLELSWQMSDAHKLHSAAVKAKDISHLGGAKLLDKKKDGKPVKEAITEPRHGAAFVRMAQALFTDKDEA